MVFKVSGTANLLTKMLALLISRLVELCPPLVNRTTGQQNTNLNFPECGNNEMQYLLVHKSFNNC